MVGLIGSVFIRPVSSEVASATACKDQIGWRHEVVCFVLRLGRFESSPNMGSIFSIGYTHRNSISRTQDSLSRLAAAHLNFGL
jgi:hypothetical protein